MIVLQLRVLQTSGLSFLRMVFILTGYPLLIHVLKFEGEEVPEQRFTGTIVGICDVDPVSWPGSKWRCLKVQWDEISAIARPERVSP